MAVFTFPPIGNLSNRTRDYLESFCHSCTAVHKQLDGLSYNCIYWEHRYLARDIKPFRGVRQRRFSSYQPSLAGSCFRSGAVRRPYLTLRAVLFLWHCVRSPGGELGRAPSALVVAVTTLRPMKEQGLSLSTKFLGETIGTKVSTR